MLGVGLVAGNTSVRGLYLITISLAPTVFQNIEICRIWLLFMHHTAVGSEMKMDGSASSWRLDTLATDPNLIVSYGLEVAKSLLSPTSTNWLVYLE